MSCDGLILSIIYTILCVSIIFLCAYAGAKIGDAKHRIDSNMADKYMLVGVVVGSLASFIFLLVVKVA